MTQRTALLIAMGVTGFLLVLFSAVGGALLTAPSAATSTPPGAPPPATATASTPGVAAALQQALLEHDAAYEQALQEAQTQLDAATRQLAQANAQLLAAYQPQTPTASPPTIPTALADPTVPPRALVSAAQAAAAALRAAPGAHLTAQPELVGFQGKDAYEVRLDHGLVYIDAQTGQVLHNGAVAPAPPAVPPAAAGPYAGDESENGGD